MMKGLLLAYGGTIDTNGRQWANVSWEAYQAAGVETSFEQFMEAYTFGEKSLAIHPIIKPHHIFSEVLHLKTQQQFSYLKLAEGEYSKIEKIVSHCMKLVLTTVTEAKRTLDLLTETYPMVLVSNFYGNIQSVLADFGLADYFSDIVESAIIGVRKPNPAIYQLGVDRIGLNSAECVVIGDSFKKDIIPAKEVGCKTIWLNVDGIQEDLSVVGNEFADVQITDFAQLPEALQNINTQFVI